MNHIFPQFELPQWPVKLKKISSLSPYFHGAHLLVASDCVGISYSKLHSHITQGRIPVICCPEDNDMIPKLAEILKLNDIQSVLSVCMDSDCCMVFHENVREAIRLSRKFVPFQATSILIHCETVD